MDSCAGARTAATNQECRMPNVQPPRYPWLNLPSLAVVVALHVVVIYGFMHVMGIAIVTPRLPTMVRMIPDMPAPTVAAPRIDIKLPPAVPPSAAPRAASDTPAPPNAAPPAADHALAPPQIIAGDRAPVYPQAYAASAQSGHVVVDCMIETTGQPTACRVMTNSGGAAFATETLRWLNGPGHPVYRPGSRDGHALREEHHWVVSFEPPQ
jgi:hypothetical protein